MPYTRECPTCGRTLEHKDKYYRNYARKHGKECQSCSKVGRELSEEHRRKIGESNRRTRQSDDWTHFLEGKTFDKYYGEERAEEIRQAISDGNAGKTVPQEVRDKISKATRGKNHHMYGNGKPLSAEHKRKIRLSYIETMKDRWGSGPAYNPEACRFIEKYGEANGFEFKHAENGGEHFIEDLGYWVDGYDAEQNVVLEYYEPWHRKSSNRSRDKARREEIMSHLGCTFIVHREWDGTTTKYE